MIQPQKFYVWIDQNVKLFGWLQYNSNCPIVTYSQIITEICSL